MYGIIDFPLYLIGVLTIVFIPGPNSMYCLSVATRAGVREASKVMAAIFVGDSILMTLAAGGAASVLHANPLLFHALQIIGGLYLAYLGLHTLHQARQHFQAASIKHTQPEHPATHHENVFKHALTLSLMNPKAILFFLSFFIPFVNPSYPHPTISFLLLATTMQLISMCYLFTLSLIGSHVARWFSGKPKIGAAGLAAVGILFCAFALKLWLAAFQAA